MTDEIKQQILQNAIEQFKNKYIPEFPTEGYDAGYDYIQTPMTTARIKESIDYIIPLSEEDVVEALWQAGYRLIWTEPSGLAWEVWQRKEEE